MKKQLAILLLIFSAIQLSSQNCDIDLLKEINLNRNINFDSVFEFITNSAAFVSIAIPVGLWIFGYYKKNSLTKRNGLKIGLSFLTSALIASILKYSINRPRPFITYPYLQAITDGGSPSFPSGHTADAFVTATSLSLTYPKWYIIIPVYLWAAAVGYSRMALGVHYPSDVFVAILIGVGSAFLCHKINNFLKK